MTATSAYPTNLADTKGPTATPSQTLVAPLKRKPAFLGLVCVGVRLLVGLIGCALAVGIVLGVWVAPASAATSHTAYVVNPDSNSLTPINTATNAPAADIVVNNSPSDIAITPDGKTAYVSTGPDVQSPGSVTPINTATNTVGTPITVGNDPREIAITPDGKTAYVANRLSVAGLGDSPGVIPIDTATNTEGTPIRFRSEAFYLAITPDGKTAYVTNQIDGTVTPIETATNQAGTPFRVGGLPLGIALTPDGRAGYVANFATSGVSGSGGVTPIDFTTNPPTPAPNFIHVGSHPEAVAVTPDQGPVAAFSATAAPAGQASSFDASASSDPEGTVASYHWDFGDGSSQTTTSATITHTYATSDAHTVTLTVTDDEGCSTTQTFTGQTVSCNGSGAARVSHQLSPPPLPVVLGVSPGSGPAAGGTTITITGTGFVSGASVEIGQGAGAGLSAIPATVKTVSPTRITATTGGPAKPGTHNVFVVQPGGTSLAGPTALFTYDPVVSGVSPASGPATGGTPITITGIGFEQGATVSVGSGRSAVPATVMNVTSTDITAVTGAQPRGGSYYVRVSEDGVTSPVNAGARFTYTGVPVVTGVSPASGPRSGGTPITITGSGFAPGASVVIGQGQGPGPTAIPATVMTVSSTQITATTGGPAKAGTFYVYVMQDGGTSRASNAGRFTYTSGAP